MSTCCSENYHGRGHSHDCPEQGSWAQIMAAQQRAKQEARESAQGNPPAWLGREARRNWIRQHRRGR